MSDPITSRQLKSRAREDVRMGINQQIEIIELEATGGESDAVDFMRDIPKDQWPAYVLELKRIEEGI